MRLRLRAVWILLSSVAKFSACFMVLADGSSCADEEKSRSVELSSFLVSSASLPSASAPTSSEAISSSTSEVFENSS